MIDNMRSHLFFNVRKFQTQCAETLRRDSDQSERVPAEHYSYLLVNTEFVFLFVFIII